LERDFVSGGRRPLIIACGIYSLAYFFYLFFPFDFALSVEDLRGRLPVLPYLLLSWPGGGTPTSRRVILVLVATIATIPLGVLLAVKLEPISIPRIAVTGFLMMSAATVVS